MKQLHVREPWVALAYNSSEQLLEDLLHRIEVLEARVRDLERREFEAAVSDDSATHREAVALGV